ncbi:MAG TPA: class I SAM-dependent methyltransferase [Hyphomonadaceae bacterium]|jgi:2-polyprenyl-3-methyl-5-hydroxy-6-metoxy-1,4-benzoquinol methylase|nr:class I SAM-dependent methyltransferase [Hyphomonadaceae bacterium]
MKNPAAAIWHELRYAIDRALKTGERKHEFEAKYRKHGDYFGYRSNPYELEKYERTLALMRLWRPDTAQSALEIGCSVGVFTKMIAAEFSRVTAVDIAKEALAIAATEVGSTGQVTYVQSDLLSLKLNQTFDVIFCAEVLMYIREPDAPAACKALDDHLAPGGIIIEVSQQDRESGRPKFFHGWATALGEYFEIAHREKFDDPTRPYEIVAYQRRR